MTIRKASALALALGLSFFASGCKKKIGAPPPIVAKTVATTTTKEVKTVARPIVKFFTAEPSTIERGQASELRWEITGADTASINQGIGVIGTASPDAPPATMAGNRSVFPGATTSYTLTARNAGGEVTENVTVNVVAPPPPKVKDAPPPVKVSFSEEVSRQLKDAFFDFDKSDIREDSRNTLTQNSDAMKALFREYPAGTITIEGHCDERGSAEYNLGLGDRRAIAAKEFLTQLGVPAERIRTLSYGKERPQCTDASEDCWQRNRRAHFTGQ